MAGIIYEFMDGLRAETKLYDELCGLGIEKRAHLIKGDIEKITEITSKEETVVTKLKGFERRRKQIMRDISTILNISPENVTITKIEEAISNQPDESKELAKIREALIKSLEKLNITNQDNMSLINQSLEYAQFSINLLQSSVDGPVTTSNYGREDDGGRSKSYFDAKQ